MKIFCVIDNYRSSNVSEEVKAVSEVLWYLLPDSTVVRSENPMFVPDFCESFVAYPSLVIRIEKIGKNISPKFAPRYYKSFAPGLAVQAPGLLSQLREKGLPWTKAVVFDRCCMLGEFTELTEDGVIPAITFEGEDKSVSWDIVSLFNGVDEVVAALSRENTLKIGDLIFVGLRNEGFKLNIGENISAKIGEEVKLNIRLR